MSLLAWPKALAVRGLRNARPRPRALWPCRIFLCWLALFAVGSLPSQQIQRSSPDASGLESPLPEFFYQREAIKEQAREETERFRTRIELPQGAFASQPAAFPTAAADPATSVAVASNSRQEESADLATKYLYVLLGFAVWLLLARKYSPEFASSLTSWFTSRVLLTSVSPDRLVTLLAEEKSVAEFQAALRAGTSASGATSAPDPLDVPATVESLFSPVASHIRNMRRLLEEAGRTVAPPAQRRFVIDVLDEIRLLKNLARPAELLPLRQLTGALEMLLKQLTEKSSNITSSTLRTASLAATMLEDLCRPGLKPDLLSEPPFRLLAVDDETFSRYALAHSLKRGLNEPEVADNGVSALALATKRTYDLIVLDVQMPGMDGFELCARIHETPANRTTPVIFVTSQRDFDSRANSILCGGRDLIAKPFLTFELTVKALTLVAGERLRGRGMMADASVEEVKTEVPAAPVAVEAAGTAVLETTPAPEVKASPFIPKAAPAGVAAAFPLEPAASAFFTHAREQINTVIELIELTRVTPEQSVQREILTDLLLGVHMLAMSAEASAQHSIAMIASALEGLLKKLMENTANLSPSALQTVASSAALIHDLCLGAPGPDVATTTPIRALVVDDDPVALRALSYALQVKFSKPEHASDGKSALALAVEKPFDVIFLDVQMPDSDGFEVCTKIRETAANRWTPVLFLTNHDDPALRVQSELCGANDFLTKKCLGSELTLKALDFAIRGRLQKNGRTAYKEPESGAQGDARVDASMCQLT